MMNLIDNRKARYDYEFLETFEAGLVLEGWEVKSIRARNANLKAAWVRVKDGEAFLENFKVALYPFSQSIQEPERKKKLLLTKKELLRLENKSKENRCTIVPIQIFIKDKYIKCKIAVARGRKKYEKRQVLKDRANAKEAKKIINDFNG